MCSTWLVQRKTISHLLSLFASAELKTQRFSAETARLFSALTQSSRFTKHLVLQRLPKVRIKEALPFNLSMIVTSSLVPQSFHRSLNHFSESLELRVDIWRRPRRCDQQRTTRTSWLYLFPWKISQSLNLAPADPWCDAITLCKAPSNYKHILYSSEGRVRMPPTMLDFCILDIMIVLLQWDEFLLQLDVIKVSQREKKRSLSF